MAELLYLLPIRDGYDHGRCTDAGGVRARMSDDDIAAEDSTDAPSTDGGQNLQSYTVRLELVDEPGELLNALQPISERGGNLLSIFHERGNLTPRGHIPVEVDIECPPDRFKDIVAALREAGINVIQAGAERYSEELTVILVGHLIDTDLSDSLQKFQQCSRASVVDMSLSAPEGTEEVSSARLRLATEADRADEVLGTIREIAADKEIRVIEPQLPTEGSR